MPARTGTGATMMIRLVLPFLILLTFGNPVVAESPKQPKLSHYLTRLQYPLQAPDFTLQDMDEENHRLEDYKGKVIMLNFWATWCPPCRREMPSMERLHKMLPADSFAVIAINQMESPDHVFAYTGQLEVDPTFTILFDTDSSVSRRYGVKGLPTSYIIDKRGYIRYRAVGGREFDHPEVVNIIRKLMAE
jgi:thiol-disulfide isomerase/thioredoxin